MLSGLLSGSVVAVCGVISERDKSAVDRMITRDSAAVTIDTNCANQFVKTVVKLEPAGTPQ